MTTPFDAALRAMQLEMDALVDTIADTARRRTAAEQRHGALIRLVTDERGLNAREWHLPQTLWLDRSRMEIDALVARQDEIEAELAALRETAVTQQAMLRALEDAAERWLEEAGRVRDRAEQAEIDDLIGTRSARAMARRREAA